MIKHELSMMSSDKIHFNITRGDEPPDVVVVLFVVVVVLFVVVVFVVVVEHAIFISQRVIIIKSCYNDSITDTSQAVARCARLGIIHVIRVSDNLPNE